MVNERVKLFEWIKSCKCHTAHPYKANMGTLLLSRYNPMDVSRSEGGIHAGVPASDRGHS